MTEATQILACDVLNQATPIGSPVEDSKIIAICQKCGAIALSNCTVSQSKETIYRDPRCSETLLIIGAPILDGPIWPGRGYRFGDFLFRNAVDLYVSGIRIDACPHALAPTRG